jgi:hypothetical protein
MGYNCLFTYLGVTVFRRSDDSVAFKRVLEGQPLVHRSSVVAVENVFILAFLSSASARGQWKSAFPLAVILEPPVKRAFSLAVFLRNR